MEACSVVSVRTVAHPDNELVARAQRGDRTAFRALYERYAAELYRKVLMPRCGQADAAEEALAETFRTLVTALVRYEPHPAGPWPWLSRVASSKAMDVHRARARKARALANFTRLVTPLVPEEFAPDEATRERERSDLSRAVQDALAELSPRYRQAIELRFFEELARDECAARMQITLGNFDVTLLRALRAFRAAWESRHTRESTP
jgi:RNA polymerase sigma factor (sigma-70 family)